MVRSKIAYLFTAGVIALVALILCVLVLLALSAAGVPDTPPAIVYAACALLVLWMMHAMRPGKGLPTHFGG